MFYLGFVRYDEAPADPIDSDADIVAETLEEVETTFKEFDAGGVCYVYEAEQIAVMRSSAAVVTVTTELLTNSKKRVKKA